MNITGNDVRAVVHDIRSDFDAFSVSDEAQFLGAKQQALNQMRGVLKLVSLFKISSFVLMEMGNLKAVQYKGASNGNS